ncbi:membrane protein [Arthrobacter phage Popper]|uniref:Membrane protein n=1 Tax=Arthrobacter phage Popper TaxID=2859633 RepID=A0AAE8BEG4_9CAUD|nr:membrane protein [Arthrobacter phage Popper]QYC54940.1 membrane protein [Arthrobacter phage Popper]
MDLQWLGALGTFLGVLGGGYAWLVNRADKRRDSREAQVIQTLKDRIEELKKTIAALRRKLAARTRAGDRWREQLVAHDIKPDPAEWPEDPDDE